MIDVEELQAWLKLDPGTDDEILGDLEGRAVAFLQEQTGRYFGEPAEITVYLSGNCQPVLWLDEKPVADTTVRVERQLSFGNWEDVDTGDYEIRDYQLIHRYSWPKGPNGTANIRVTFTRGYSAGNEPEDIQQAVLDLVSLIYGRRGHEGMKSEAIGGYSYAIADIDAVHGLKETIDFWRWRL